MNRSERETLDRIQQELEKALWSLRQLVDQVDAEHEAECKANTLAENSEGDNGKRQD